MSYNKISRARNLLKEARAAVGEIRLDYEAYGKPFVILLTETYADLDEAIAILGAPRQNHAQFVRRDREALERQAIPNHIEERTTSTWLPSRCPSLANGTRTCQPSPLARVFAGSFPPGF